MEECRLHLRRLCKPKHFIKRVTRSNAHISRTADKKRIRTTSISRTLKNTERVNELTEESSKYAFVVSVVLSVLGVSFLLLHCTEKTLRDHIQVGTGLYVYIYLLGVSVIQFWHRCTCISWIKTA